MWSRDGRDSARPIREVTCKSDNDARRYLFQSLLTDEQISNAPVLILGNKIDIPGAASEDELRMYFGLHGQSTGKVRALSFLRCWWGGGGLNNETSEPCNPSKKQPD